MRQTIVKAALCGAMLLATTAQAALSPTEQKIGASVDAGHEPAIALLEKIVNQNSGSMNVAGVKAVADMLRPEFEALGFTVSWKPMDQVKRAGHFIAVHKGKAGTTKMLLIGHLDTVFEPDSPFQTFKREGDWAAGPGVGDDKGGVVTMLLALKAMQAAGTLKNANIEVVLTGDEEDSGDPVSIARADLIAAGKRADVALDFEGLSREDGKDMGSIARRSSNSWTLTTSGKSAHSSGIFSAAAGDGAVYEMARIITAFRKELPEPNLTFNVGLIGGGQSADVDKDGVRIAVTGKTNIIPPIAVAKGDFRTLSQDQTERVRAKMQAIVDNGHLPGTGASIAFDLGYPSMAPTAGNRALLGKLNGINKDLGLPEMPELDPLKRGAGDISFVAQDVDGLVGLGLASTGDHSPAEKADLSTMPRQAKRAAILMTRLSAEKGRK
ncbi:M20/M25/M40 family metallo-hydrolase [Sphingobium yanoikuyae]|uniref:Acetylornithine deacetylase/succinyldiaminopimelate desuccinylase-like deacylase n=1 Tax=Sphingobium yanoikuyae TaxID=13690 RepID=A0A084EKU8_SPHYA|nr:M20/M25/M40 family metallo-hydrolase [Sphingobium yanoikuyae]ATI80380.1 peptidase M20 [Sphingobium yanoikuyae]KEZ18590.1 Acetylornithine deacetylase/succinyldiaminopimelate desuccinylase-like deacylase precursor [Sphingobium yanoikuyae]